MFNSYERPDANPTHPNYTSISGYLFMHSIAILHFYATIQNSPTSRRIRRVSHFYFDQSSYAVPGGLHTWRRRRNRGARLGLGKAAWEQEAGPVATDTARERLVRCAPPTRDFVQPTGRLAMAGWHRVRSSRGDGDAHPHKSRFLHRPPAFVPDASRVD